MSLSVQVSQGLTDQEPQHLAQQRCRGPSTLQDTDGYVLRVADSAEGVWRIRE